MGTDIMIRKPAAICERNLAHTNFLQQYTCTNGAPHSLVLVDDTSVYRDQSNFFLLSEYSQLPFHEITMETLILPVGTTNRDISGRSAVRFSGSTGALQRKFLSA